MKTMTKLLGLGVAATIAATLGQAAFADMPQRGGKGGAGMMHQMGDGNGRGQGYGRHGQQGQQGQQGRQGHGVLDSSQIEALRIELGITDDQESSWDKYAKVLQENAEEVKSIRKNIDREAIRKMSPEDRRKFRSGMRKQGQERFETVKKAANELLEALDEAQKAKAVDTLPGLRKGGPGMHKSSSKRGHKGGHMGGQKGGQMGGKEHGKQSC